MKPSLHLYSLFSILTQLSLLSQLLLFIRPVDNQDSRSVSFSFFSSLKNLKFFDKSLSFLKQPKWQQCSALARYSKCRVVYRNDHQNPNPGRWLSRECETCIALWRGNTFLAGNIHFSRSAIHIINWLISA